MTGIWDGAGVGDKEKRGAPLSSVIPDGL